MTDNNVNVTSTAVPADEVFTLTINKTKLKKYLLIGTGCIAVGALGTIILSKSDDMVELDTNFDDDRKHDVTVDLNPSE